MSQRLRVLSALICAVSCLVGYAQNTVRLVNLSTRFVGGGAGVGPTATAVNFLVEGTTVQPVLIRAVGPTLGVFGVGGVLADPILTVYGASGAKVAENDDWANGPGLSSAFATVGAFAFALSSKDAALILNAAPGAYTAIVSGANGTSGVALLEVYELDSPASPSRIPYVAYRGLVGTGADIAIAGFVVGGSGTTGTAPVLIRGLGPALGAAAGAGVLADPTLSVSAGITVVGANDNWDGSANSVSVAATAGLVPLTVGSRDAVAQLTLNGGAYTAQLSGVGGTTGIGMIEITQLDNRAATFAPALLIPPYPVSTTAGSNVVLSAFAIGRPAPTYQWRKDTMAIAGATTSALALGNVQSAQTGSYSVVLTNPAGTITSTDFVVTVAGGASAPNITTQPSAQAVVAGATATFSVTASGTAPLTYQWFRDGLPVSDGGGATLTLTNVQQTSVGAYTVRVTNAQGSITSAAATLTIVTPPAIAGQPVSQTVVAGARTTLALVATGSAPLTYQWRKDGVAISGATAASFTLASTQLSDAGNYTCVVSNSAGSVISNGATLSVQAPVSGPPTIITQPTAQTVDLGGAVTFTVTANGKAPLAYQWQRNGTDLSGATNAAYTVSAAQASDVGSYVCVISNSEGRVSTTPVPLTVRFPGPTARLVNLSILTDLSSASDSFTLGYVVAGESSVSGKSLVIRAAGPSLGALGVPGTVTDPKLELFAGETKSVENDDWGGVAAVAAAMANVGAFGYIGPASKDAALLADVTTTNNSVKVSASGGGTILAEIYDATPSDLSTRRLTNVSVLKPIGAGLTAGFVIGGTGTKKVLIRAVGPTLGTLFNLPGVLADPQLTLFSGETPIASNDNWNGTSELTAAFMAVGAFGLPTNSRDAAVLATLEPGSYSVRVSGANNTTGTAIVEIYEVP